MIVRTLRPYGSTARLCATQKLEGSLLTVGAGYAVRVVQMLVLIAVFRSLPESGTSVSRLVAYTVLSSALSEQLFIFTPATTALWEGSIIGRFTRPLPVMGGFIAETVGRWIPSLVFYTAPVLLVSALLGVRLQPASPLQAACFALSLLLGISLGFAIDFIFSAFSMRLKNACWAALIIREALTALLSGALIPFALLPKTVAMVLSVLPFASLAGAPLSIYTGAGSPLGLLTLSMFWNLLLWPVSLLFFHKSREQMISFGG